MALIKSISGIRGTIGGKPGDHLTPIDIVECTAAFGALLLEQKQNPKIVLGRDARISGPIVSNLVTQTLIAMGFEVVDLGISTTPTVEIAVPEEHAGGGIIVTASHNPRQWNALKFLNHQGEFISAEAGEHLLHMIEKKVMTFASVDKLGTYRTDASYVQKHIDKIFALELVQVEAVRSKQYRVVVDCINSSGAISIVPLLEQMGCEVIVLNGNMTGDFAHNPEPLPENLSLLSQKVLEKNAHLGIAIDPDVDRLALVCEDGEMFGEEYTLVAVADYVLRNQPGPTVSNLSSTRALRDLTLKFGCDYHAAAVGEVNVVAMMKETGAVIGGEGNGGIIYPDLHYGRDALVGIALFLSHLSNFKMPVSYLRSTYPYYAMSKEKIELNTEINTQLLFEQLKLKYKSQQLSDIDGLKIDLEDGWIHLRRSNTEPILRIYTEGISKVIAENLSAKIKSDIGDILKGRLD